MTAVQVAALGGDASPEARLGALRAALAVPFAAAVAAALITAFGLRARRGRPAEPARAPVETRV